MSTYGYTAYLSNIKFRKSHLYISILPPIFIGLLVGILSSIMGVGGGFILVPAMIYILGMPTQVVIGTSLLQIVFVTTVSTIMHSYINQTVDVVFVFLVTYRCCNRSSNWNKSYGPFKGRAN